MEVDGHLLASAALPPRKDPWYPLDMRLRGPQSRSGRRSWLKVSAVMKSIGTAVAGLTCIWKLFGSSLCYPDWDLLCFSAFKANVGVVSWNRSRQFCQAYEISIHNNNYTRRYMTSAVDTGLLNQELFYIEFSCGWEAKREGQTLNLWTIW
jgi:hypothetical protein